LSLFSHARFLQGSSGSDPYYGHEPTAKLCGRFVSHLFACPDVPHPPAPTSSAPTPRLDHFIAYALHRTRLHQSVTFAALYLLQRLKARFPAAKGSSGHRLFISAFMLASKIICDDTYSNKSWCIVGQGMFALREINQMEREMCSYLEWQLNVDPTTLRDFESRVRHDFAGPGPYPAMVLPQSAPAPFAHPSASSNVNSSSSCSIPSFTTRVSLPKDAPPVVPSPAIPYPSSPPDTPEASHSVSTSPASSVSPQTPPDAHAPGFIKVASANSSPVEAPVIPHGHGPISMPLKPAKTVQSIANAPSAVPSQKPKTSHGQFAYATRAVW
jgi:Cyclin, N-terminal domain